MEIENGRASLESSIATNIKNKKELLDMGHTQGKN
jgi:hypothetical protein